MDKLTLTSTVLFIIADIFAITALIMPDWIVTDVGGKDIQLNYNIRRGIYFGYIYIHYIIVNFGYRTPVGER